MESFDKNATTYPTFNFLQREIAGELLALCASNLPPMRSCIDIGCGNGALFDQIAAAREADSPQWAHERRLHVTLSAASISALTDVQDAIDAAVTSKSGATATAAGTTFAEDDEITVTITSDTTSSITATVTLTIGA